MGSNALMSSAAVGWGANLPDKSTEQFFVNSRHGSTGNNGFTIDRHFLTIQAALTAAVSGRRTVIHVAPGEYRETLDILKPYTHITGYAGSHPGATRITGDGSTARATIRVLASNNATRGFGLSNLFVETGYPGVTSLSQPAIHIETDDADDNDTETQLGALTPGYHWEMNNVWVISDGNPTAGLLLEGGNMGISRGCVFAGCVNGIVFAYSSTNGPMDIEFHKTRFYNNTTADVCTSASASTLTAGGTITAMDSVNFFGPKFLDRGGTPVTDYINMAVTTAVNCGFYDFRTARQVADGTLFQLPTDVIAIGKDPVANRFLIGS